MTILYCFPGWGRSGGARVVGEHVNRLVARGHDVVMYSNDRCRPDWFDLQCPLIDAGDLRDRFDVVVVTNPTTVDVGLIPEAGRRVYFVQMAEHLFFAQGSPGYQTALRTYRLAVARGFRFVTIAGWLVDFLRSVGASDVHHIPNGVNREHFYPVDQPVRPPPYVLIEGDSRNQAKDVDSIGWRVALELRKEFGLQLRGMAAVKHSYADQLDRFVLNPTLADYRELYSGAQFLLKASRYEGRSLAPLEAMVCGTPTCRAIIQGDDDLRHRRTCLRVGYDYGALLEAARGLAQGAGLATLAHNATRYAAQHLRWDPIVDELEELLLGP